MLLWIVISVYAAASLVAFIAYGIDKSKAIGQRRRIPERTLHLFELLGGWPGALLGQRLFRHKRRKTSYMLAFAAIVLLHAGAWVAWWRMRP